VTIRRTLVLALLLSACSSGPQIAGITVAEGTNISRIEPDKRREAPPLEGETLRSGDFEASRTLGKVTVVNFWGSWCGPCRVEEPRLEEAWKTLEDEGVVFLGVNTRRDQRAAAIAFLEEFEVTYPSIYDPDSNIAYAYGVRVMPATFVIDPDGKIAAQILGAVRSSEELVTLVREVQG
jgi:thiol-disulfide isomerase/thioredoxin